MLKNGKSIIITTDIVAASLLVISCNAFAETTGSATFSVDIADTILELSVPSNPAVINLNPTMTGTAFGTANVTISAATNNQTGYTITMTPDSYYEDVALVRTELVGDEEDYRRIEALEPTTPASTGYTEETFTSNTWGYRILNNTNYYGIDENNPTISHPAWTTDAPTNGTTHNLTLATKIDATTVSGSYEATLNFSAVTNAVVAKDNISFDKNNDNASGAMEPISIVVGRTENLPANTFTAPSSYRFSGWSTVASGLGGKVYGDQAPYTPEDVGYTRNITLYAQWTPSNMPNPSGGSSSTSGTTFTRAYEIAYTAMHKGMYEEQHEGQGDYALVNSWPPTSEPYKNYDVRFAMQDMTPEICASVTAMHDDYEALDVRDNKLYHITKLQDGSCWMTQNLDLDLSDSVELSSNETDLEEYDTAGYKSTEGYRKSGDVIYWLPNNSTIQLDNDGHMGWRGDYFSPISSDAGNWYEDGTYFSPSDCDYTRSECVHYSTTPYPTNGTHGHMGNYYNYPAAVASNAVYYDGWDDNTINNPDARPKNSICPKGWRLPISNSNYTQGILGKNDFYNVRLTYDPANTGVSDQFAFIAPIYSVRGGYLDPWNGGAISSSGHSGVYWSSLMASRPVNSSFEGIYATNLYSNAGTNIRCIAK